jgi:ribosomal protein S18 acetylase RimI-like enzyme
LLTNHKFHDDETYELDDELQISIRRAKLSDIDELNELEKVCFTPDKGRFERHEIEGWLENSSATFFVVESVEKDLIGYGLYQEFDEDAPDAEIQHNDDIKTAEIVCIAVHPYYQKLHIGSKLLDMVHDLAVQNGCGRFLLEVGVANLDAIRFYENKGYAEIKELENYYQKGVNAYLMEARPDSIVMHRLHSETEENDEVDE